MVNEVLSTSVGKNTKKMLTEFRRSFKKIPTESEIIRAFLEIGLNHKTLKQQVANRVQEA